MKLFAVSDIHGYAGLLKEALRDAGYDPDNEDHLLVCCGDVFDRGTENREVLKFFERIDRKVMIKGNHEARLLEILDTGKLKQHDAINGTIETVHEFFGKYSAMSIFEPVDFSGKTGTVDRLYDFIGGMRDYFETENYIFVHGWLPNDYGVILPDWRNAPESKWNTGRWTWWTKGCKMSGNSERKTIVCGHYPTEDTNIFHGDGFIAIDAGTYTSMRVNVLVVDDELTGGCGIGRSKND